MSGIAGIVRLDGQPVDLRLLRGLTECLAFRGPDAQQVWGDGGVALGHALLRTTREPGEERQPATLDGQVWITADARIDGREELISTLRAHGRDAAASSSDAELILHAYVIWNGECVQYLLGDFAFALWDGREQRLFCARDHFGLKPFYYAQVGQSLVFSNTLDAVRAHPEVSDRLNDLAMTDFLLFGFNQELDTTTFADIRRLPPAHTLTRANGTTRTQRYWEMPVEGLLRYDRAGEYVEHFRELLRTAVRDRLRTDRVGVLMSGGLDSTSVASVAHQELTRKCPAFDLQAYTGIAKGSREDPEGRYAGLVAHALGIPIHHQACDGYKLYERWDQPELRTPEPYDWPLAAINADQYRSVSANCRVLLSGEGGDVVFYTESGPYVAQLLSDLRWFQLFVDAGRTAIARRRLPPLGIRTALRALSGKPPWQPAFPVWLNPGLEARLDLRARWERYYQAPTSNHPLRPRAYAMLTAPLWPYVFGSYDPEMTSVALDVRHPFFDVRLARFLLRVPPLPWCVDKQLLREAMDGHLPRPVVRRPKTPLAIDPILESLSKSDVHWLDHHEWAPELQSYVDPANVPSVAGETDVERLWINIRPHTLSFWLRGMFAKGYKVDDGSWSAVAG